MSSLGLLLTIYLVKRGDPPSLPNISYDRLPTLTIQLPIYNERSVISRLLDACARLDYPVDKLQFQILDDSTDETSSIINQWLQRANDCRFHYIHRKDRTGYKAGALQHGLMQVETEFVVIFDADFVPPADFLLHTLPYFVDQPRLGLIQTRWSHLNADYNLLTRAQALSIDAHFAVEQLARNRGHLPMAMNGTGGIWRVKAIHDSGGWSSDTLTEDLDLSYRAYLGGWDFLFLPDIHAPGEIPPFVPVFKLQQARWATGSTQNLLKLGLKLLTANRLSPIAKVMGLLHLCQYVIQLIILLLFLLTPILLASGGGEYLPNLSILAMMGIIPPIIVAIGQIDLYKQGWKHLIHFPVQFIISAAVVLNNSIAVLVAFSHYSTQFRRTPKFRLSKSQRTPIKHNNLRIDVITYGELLLACYALWGTFIALKTQPTLAPYMFSYTLSFSVFAMSTIIQVRLQQQHPLHNIPIKHSSIGLD